MNTTIILNGFILFLFIGLYITFLAIITSIRVMRDSTYFDHSTSFMDLSIEKYRKSSLTEDRKKEILRDITFELNNNRYYTGNLASLSVLAKKIGRSSSCFTGNK